MKLLIVLSLAAAVLGAPQTPQRAAQDVEEVKLTRFESDHDGLGSYSYAFEQSDGTKKEEQGELKNAGTDEEFVAVKGSYSWLGPDNILYTVTYTADEEGFKPTIEQGPGGAIPPGVVASLLG